MNPGNLSYEEKLLYNALLFCEIRSPKEIDEKLLNIEKYISIGVDVNTQDANDFNNTPLHVAVKKDELEIVDLLLKKGANPNLKNKHNQTPSDLANVTQNKIIEYIIASVSSIKVKSNNEIKMSNRNNSKVLEEKALRNESRPGASGIGGQLYESKLIGLLLHRALNDHDIDEFYIGSNLIGLGAFDDITFKYHLKNKENPNILFIQTKHRDDPKKNKLTIDSLLNSNTDFSLDKYFDSYMTIQDKMKLTNENVMQDNDVPISDRHFIIYTPAMENLDKKKSIQVNGKENLILTNDSKNGFLYDYDDRDIEVFMAKFLAKKFAANIVGDKFKNMLRNDIIAEYHVFFAQHIVINPEICSKVYVASFNEKFMENKNEILMIFRETLIKEMKLQEGKSLDSLMFKLPKYFGNVEVPLSDEEYIELWKVMKHIIEKNEITILDKNISRIVIKNNVTGKIIKKTDLKKIRNLVGDTLILDDETGLFKFNFKESSNKNKILIERLKSNIKIESDLKELRFHIEMENFPQLSLRNEGNLKKNLTNFLDKFQLYTNQGNEEEVERILINEINDLYNRENGNNNKLFHIQARAIYLDYHDRVQNWWKDTEKKQYLTKSCEFYKQAKESILSFPLIYIYNYIYVSKIGNLMISFDEIVIEDFRKKALMKLADANALNIVTNDVIFTSIKLKQCFNGKKYVFIDLADIKLSSDIEIILSEISRTTVDAIIFILNDQNYFLYLERKIIDKLYNKNVIFVSDSSLPLINECSIHIDEKNTLNNLGKEIKHKIINESNFILQGSKVPFISLTTESMYDLIKGNVLHSLIKNNAIEIGKEPIIKNTEPYVGRRICRCLELKITEGQYSKEFNFIKDKEIAVINNNKDILIISNDSLAFYDNCKKHCDKNIHWFKNVNNNVKWIKSQGSIKKIMKWVEKIECDGNDFCSLEVQSLNQLDDRVVIISAGAGMGKSTLLNHLMTQTKSTHECIECVVKLNLLHLTNEFSLWQEQNTGVRLGRFMSILYKEFSINKTGFLNSDKKGEDVFDNMTYFDIDNRIYLSSKNITGLHQQPLFELKIFLNLYNNNKLSLLLDGLDEIFPDFKKEAMQLLNLLLNSQIKCIWITTRPMIISELERAMNSFSYTLNGFSKNEQVMYLEKFLELTFVNINHVNNKKPYIIQFLDVLSHKIMDTKKHFTSTPLHLRMISNALREHFEDYILNSTPIHKNAYSALNLTKLYETFIITKFNEIRFGEKKDVALFTDPDMIKIKERERILFLEDHKKLAAYSLLHKKIKYDQINELHKYNLVAAGILKKDDFKHIRRFIKRFNSGEEKTGIIDIIVGNKPRFVHLTYTEYFSCELICDKLNQKGKNNESFSKFFIDHVLLADETEGIRRFLDAKLECDQTLSKVTFKNISVALLNQRFYSKTALNIAVMEGKHNIALFLLNNINEFLNNDNVDDFIAMLLKKMICCTLCSTYNYRGLGVISQIIEMIQRVDCTKLEKLFFCEDYPNSNIFMLCIYDFGSTITRFRLSVDIIVKLTSSEVLIKLLLSLKLYPFNSYRRPILHIMVELKENMYYLNTILTKLNQKQCMRVFFAKDKMRRIPAHFAACYNNFEFFDVMATFLSKKQLKRLYTYKDKNGIIPLRSFGSIMFFLDKFKVICEKAGIGFGFKDEGGWFLYDMDSPDCIW